MTTATATRGGAAALYRQLCEDFPPAKAKWVLSPDVTVLPLRRVPVSMIDLANRKNWNAGEHPAKIKRFRLKLRAGRDKPIILVRRPGHKNLMVADGHHRSIAAWEEGRAPLAYVCIVKTVEGPWDEMHAAQRNSQGGVKLATPSTATTQPQQQQQQDNDGKLILALAVILGASAIVSGTVGLVTAGVKTELKAAGISLQIAQQALSVVMSFPPELGGISGPATHNIVRLNALRRAQFAVASMHRLTAVAIQAHSRNQDVLAALTAQLQLERRYYAQHLEAGWNRMNAAAKVDSAASSLGLLLGWNTIRDSRTSAECLAADGKNFRADIMPTIGYPGMVHPHCRCYPGPPHKGARLLA